MAKSLEKSQIRNRQVGIPEDPFQRRGDLTLISAAWVIFGSTDVRFSIHLVSKEAVDKVDLVAQFSRFRGNSEIKVTDSCIELLPECQILRTEMRRSLNSWRPYTSDQIYSLIIWGIYLCHWPLYHNLLCQDAEHSGQILHIGLLIWSHRRVHIYPEREGVMRSWKEEEEEERVRDLT